jgi:hypothetical protein
LKPPTLAAIPPDGPTFEKPDQRRKKHDGERHDHYCYAENNGDRVMQARGGSGVDGVRNYESSQQKSDYDRSRSNLQEKYAWERASHCQRQRKARAAGAPYQGQDPG